MLPGRTQIPLGLFCGALLALNEWGLGASWTPRAAAVGRRPEFGAWHGVSAVFYVLACVAVLLLVWNEDLR